MNKDVCAVIVTWNPGKTIEQSLDAIAFQVEKVFIVDNASDPDSIAVIQSLTAKHRNTAVIRNKTNEGLATGLNRGVAYALEQGYQWIVTLDQDSMAESTMIKKMLDTYNILNAENKNNIAIIAPNYTTAKGLAHQQKEPLFVVTTITSGQMIKSEVFRAIGLFQENLFIECVDHEFCFRTLKAGLKTMLVPQAIIRQRIGNPQIQNVLGRKIIIPHYAPARYYYLFRNSIVLYKKYLGLKRVRVWILNNWLTNFIVFAKILLFEKNKLEKIGMTIKGVFDGFRNRLGKLR